MTPAAPHQWADVKPNVNYWVWTQHGDARFISAPVGDPGAAVERFADDAKVPFGTTIYVTAADNAAAFKVGAMPRG